MRSIVPLFGSLIVILLISCESSTTGITDDDGPGNVDCVSNQFTSHVTDLSMIKAIVPSGNVGADNEIVGRSYLHVEDDVRDARTRVPIYAPAAATLISLAYYRVSSDPADQSDYAMTFALACDVTFGFAHIKEVVPKIAAVAPSTPSSSSQQGAISATVTFDAGELIGYWIGDAISIAYDFIVEDRSQENQFVNQARYQIGQFSNALYQVCPYSSYTEDLRDLYYMKLGSTNGPVAGVTNCRGTSRDVSGALSGTWFLDADHTDGTATTNNGVYRYRVDVAQELDGEIKIGGLGSTLLRVGATNSSHSNPESMSASHCYQFWETPSELNSTGYVYFSVTTSTEMLVSYSSTGICPARFPAEDAVTYYR